MSNDPNDVVRVAAGDMVLMELYKQAITEEGIVANVVGEDLEAGIGTAIPRSVEVWVHQADAPRARAIIREMEEEEAEARAVAEPDEDTSGR
jgi:hypothetical protein